MLRQGWWAVLVVGLGALPAPAQAPSAAFRWQAGQTLAYRVTQTTYAADTVADNKAETSSTLNNVKRWRVVDVDPTGAATLELTLVSLRFETKLPNGEALLFDSAKPEGSTPQLREQMAAYVGKPLAVLRLDARGQVVAVKESRFGPASRYESEPPFLLTLPTADLVVGQSWERSYHITLEPPRGTGEKYAAMQKYQCKSLTVGTAVVRLTSELKSPPEAVADRIPLLQLLPEGEVTFDTTNGRLLGARLDVKQELKGHQGEGSSYLFKSTYLEERIQE